MKPLIIVAAFAVVGSAQAQAPAVHTPKIYSCVDKQGHHYKSDKLNPECLDRDQQELNLDASPNRVVPRPKTEDEKSEDEMKRQQVERERKEKAAGQRKDSNLLSRFPDKAAHDAARRKALDDAQTAIRNSKQRQAMLLVEKKKLADEAEFYVGKSQPAALKRAIEANDGARDGLAASIANQQQEIERINTLFDAELEHLKKLWLDQRK